MWKTSAAKDPNRLVVWLMVMKSIKGRRVVRQSYSRKSIKQIYSSGETMVPKMERHVSMFQQSEASFYNRSVSPFNCPILMRGMWTSKSVLDT
jgi:hypothetical protein